MLTVQIFIFHKCSTLNRMKYGSTGEDTQSYKLKWTKTLGLIELWTSNHMQGLDILTSHLFKIY